MSDPQEYPYVTRLDVHYKPMEIVDVKALADACTQLLVAAPCVSSPTIACTPITKAPSRQAVRSRQHRPS